MTAAREGRDVYVTLVDTPVTEQLVFHDQVIFDLDAANNIVGVEILSARSVTIDGESV